MKSKKIFLYIIFTLVFTSASSAQVPNYVPSNGLVGWWPFNGNANDASGNARHFTPFGSPSLSSDRFNKINEAYSFDPNQRQYLLNSNFPISYNSYTISAWVKVKENRNYPAIPGSPASQSIIMGQNGCNSVNCNVDEITSTGFQLHGNNNQLGFSARHRNSNGIYVATPTQNRLDTNWNFIVEVWNGNKLFLYLNNILVDSVNTNGISPLKNSFYVGCGFFNQVYYYYSGKIDDIGFWNRDLTSNEIKDLFNPCSIIPDFSIKPLDTIVFCESDSVILSSSVVGNFNYKWLKDNNEIQGVNSNLYTAKEEGAYTLIIDSLGCISKSTSVFVKVKKLPILQMFVPAFIHKDQSKIQLLGEPSGGIFSGNGVQDSLFNASIAGLGSKRISYTYTDTNLCTNTIHANTIVYDTTVCSVSVTDTLVINATLTGIKPPNNLNTLKVYPNPTNTHLTIDYGNFSLMNGYILKITNVNGQVVYTTPITQQISSIDLSTWTGKGVYFLQLIDLQNNTTENRKIIIQ